MIIEPLLTDCVVTAHRGCSGIAPENTLTAFRMAEALGVDFVEFDVRESRDGELVIMHDATLDRTTEGQGPVSAMDGVGLAKLNPAYWVGPHDTGRRVEVPTHDEHIPTLEEVLDAFGSRVRLNIQVYTDTGDALARVVRLYRENGLYGRSFLMLKTFEDGETVRRIDPDVALCIGEARDDLARHRRFDVDFMQPWRALLTPDYVTRLLEWGLPVNVFYANTLEEMRAILDTGIRGILTDRADVCRPRI